MFGPSRITAITLAALFVFSGIVVGQERRSQDESVFSGVVFAVSMEESIINVEERAFEYDENLVVHRPGVKAGDATMLRPGMRVRVSQSEREGRRFTREIWILDSIPRSSPESPRENE